MSTQWYLYAIHFTSANEGWAVGSDSTNNRGVLLHYQNGTWTSITPPAVSTGWRLSAVHFTSANEGWAVGWDDTNNRGVLLHFLNNNNPTQLTLPATYSTDVKNTGVKHYHDGSDWVGRSTQGILRTVNRWDISSIDPSWTITSVEVRFYTEAKTGAPGSLSLTRYGTSHGEDNPETDAAASAYSKINGTAYASLPEPSSGSWTGWINLGSTAASDIAWCRDNAKTTWSVGLKASSTVESSTTVRHVDFSEDNEANDAELRITYTP